jgi:hypothetical protein
LIDALGWRFFQFMKVSRHLRLAAFMFWGFGQLLLCGGLRSQTYEFEYLTTTPDFSPTYLWVTAALNTPVFAGSSILNYEINTRLGTWTPADFQSKITGEKTKPPIWSRGMIELENDGKTLDFLTTAELRDNTNFNGIPEDFVDLTTTSVSSVLGVEPGSTGTWSLVAVTPDGFDTLGILSVTAAGLVAYRRLARVQRQARE